MYTMTFDCEDGKSSDADSQRGRIIVDFHRKWCENGRVEIGFHPGADRARQLREDELVYTQRCSALGLRASSSFRILRHVRRTRFDNGR